MAEQKTRDPKYSLADFLGLPREVIFNLPEITVWSNRRLSIQNHQGITEYTANRVRVNVAGGEIEITGDSLVIRSIISEEIVLDGIIRQITF